MDARLVRESAANALRGVAIGSANVVPGVSGGTIAVVVGIYDRLIAAVGDFFSPRWRTHLLFLAPVLVGIFTGIGLFAALMEWAFATYPEQTYFFFVGLIGGSVPFLYRQVQGAPIRAHHVALFLVTLGILVAQALIEEVSMRPPITAVSALTLPVLVGTGAIATGTMIIPGVSGSFVLLVIGMYSTFLNAVRTFNVPVLIVLIVGAIVGLWAVAKVMHRLLSAYRVATYWAILGLVSGSIVGIWPEIGSGMAIAADAAAVVAGAALATVFGKGGRNAV